MIIILPYKIIHVHLPPPFSLVTCHLEYAYLNTQINYFLCIKIILFYVEVFLKKKIRGVESTWKIISYKCICMNIIMWKFCGHEFKSVRIPRHPENKRKNKR